MVYFRLSYIRPFLRTYPIKFFYKEQAIGRIQRHKNAHNSISRILQHLVLGFSFYDSLSYRFNQNHCKLYFFSIGC